MSASILSLRERIQSASEEYTDAHLTEKSRTPSFSLKAIQILRELNFSPASVLSNPLENRIESLEVLTKKLNHAKENSNFDLIMNLTKTILTTAMLAGGIFALVTNPLGVGVSVGIALLSLSLISSLIMIDQLENKSVSTEMIRCLIIPPVFVIFAVFLLMAQSLDKIPSLNREIEKEREGIETYNKEINRLLYLTNKCGLEQVLKAKIEELNRVPLDISSLPEETRKSIEELKNGYKTTLSEYIKIANYYNFSVQ